LQARLELSRVEPLTGLHCNGRLLALPANIKLGWKLMAVANTPAYYHTAIMVRLGNYDRKKFYTIGRWDFIK
jgi:hypothetical protein